jgi:4-hydroxyphenylpyruvate dioxygenase
MSAPTFAVTAIDAKVATNPLGIIRLDHIQMTGSIEKLEPLYRRMGFARVASNQGDWGRVVHLRQNKMDITIAESDDSTQFGTYFAQHGEGANALAFEVEDCAAALQEAAKRGAQIRLEPMTQNFQDGHLKVAAIQGFGDVWNYLVERRGQQDCFIMQTAKDELPALSNPGLLRVDHLTNNVGVGELDHWVDFYESIYGFVVTREFKIRGSLGTGLNSKVVQSSNNRIIIPINEPTDDKSQIQEYVNRHRGPGVQHIAMGTANIMDTLPELQNQGFNFLRTPDTYYELLPARINKSGYAVTESLDRAKQLGIQIDGDPTGYLLQIFTEDQIGPLFFEVIQRRGNRGFGEGNFQALFDSIELDQKRRGVL